MAMALWVLVVLMAITTNAATATTTTPPPTPARLFLVKLGGSAITVKDSFETLKGPALADIATTLAAAWNTTFGSSATDKLVLVHGAGSFGHFQAKEYDLKHGGRSADWRSGFAMTRDSVTRLNRHVVSSLVAAGLPAVSTSLFPTAVTRNGALVGDGGGAHLVQSVAATLQAGLVPVLHGDAVLDKENRCTIYGGDLILQFLQEHLPRALSMRDNVPEASCSVIFVTDVDGVFDRPPSDPAATLLRQLEVTPDGQVAAIQADMHTHDVTGGIQKKIEVARDLVVAGAAVAIVPPPMLGHALAGTLSDQTQGTRLILRN